MINGSARKRAESARERTEAPIIVEARRGWERVS
jgi:hypothetical protein